MRFLSLSLLLLMLAGCAPSVTTSGYHQPSPSDPKPDILGLFEGNTSVMTDVEINRILDTPWIIPEHIRVALLPLGHRSGLQNALYGGYYEDPLSATGQTTAWAAVQALLEIPGIYDAAYLPGFMIPENKSIPRLRAAATRYQSDWVLLYSSEVTANPQYHTFKKDEVFGLCLVECALLDVRTGLMPFVGRAKKEFHVKEQDGDDTMSMMVARAEQQAVDEAMLENVAALARLLENLRLDG